MSVRMLDLIAEADDAQCASHGLWNHFTGRLLPYPNFVPRYYNTSYVLGVYVLGVPI